MDPEEVQQYLDRLDEGGCYLKAVFSEHDHTRWLGTTESGYLWVIPGEGRKRQSGKDDARSTLRHYDSLQIVLESEAPSTVVKMDRGLRAFTDGGYPWNVRIDLGGVTFEGPGMGSEQEAQAIKEIVESSEPVDDVQVIRQ